MEDEDKKEKKEEKAAEVEDDEFGLELDLDEDVNNHPPKD
jgi:hypothetical protein